MRGSWVPFKVGMPHRVRERGHQFADVRREPVERDHRRRADPVLLTQPPTERRGLHPHLRGEDFLAASQRDEAQRLLPEPLIRIHHARR